MNSPLYESEQAHGGQLFVQGEPITLEDFGGKSPGKPRG